MSGNLKMTVNVSLCGSIPRSQMNFCSPGRLRKLSANVNSAPKNRSCAPHLHSSAPSLESAPSTTTMTSRGMGEGMCSTKLSLPRQVSNDSISSHPINAPSPPPIIEPPSWAVAARGEARLEPICESLHLQSPVDLTSQAVFRIGRSQNSDVQLLHCTSSRRHAILFHHPNGSCYVVDCGSAHGTYVNGVRVKTEMQSMNNDGTPSTRPSGIILPHRVKKGALIRFGGPGAPTFILKSFAVRLDSLIEKVEETRKLNNISKDVIRVNSSSVPMTVANRNTIQNTSSDDALLTLNTRLNAIGSAARSIPSRSTLLSITSARLHAQLQSQSQTSSISFLKKRSIVSFDDENDLEREPNCMKRMKMTSSVESHQPMCGSFDLGDNQEIAIVSPSRQKPTLHFDFSKIRHVVSPTPLEESEPLSSESNLSTNGPKSILTAPFNLVLPSRKKSRRVKFSETLPEVFYPPSITPDSSSD